MSTQSLLEKKVGQLLMIGMPGTSLDKNKLELLSRVGVGGFILFKENFESVRQLVEMTNSIQKVMTMDAWEGFPSWIGVDQEGGRVVRFGEPFTVFPPAGILGQLNSPKTCFEAGYIVGKELRTCGVNINFAPCADVPLALDKKIIGDRAFSTDPEVVGNLASALARGLQKGGVLSVIKHFPGHGSAEVDSHMDMPVCHKSVEELEARDWIPFKKVIRSRVEGVMTAHILYPQIDADRPATLSRKIIQDYLRKSMRHSKLIFTDDLEMGAITKKYGLKDAAFLAVEAGCDQLLICHEWQQVEEVWQYLVKAFDSGALNIKRLDESLERISDAKRRFLHPFVFSNPDLALAIVGAPDFKAVAVAVKELKVVENGPSSKISDA